MSQILVADNGIKKVINGNSGNGSNVVEDSAGNKVRRVGNRNWRNNNPGNIIKGSFSSGKGAIGDDGTFAIFPTADQGFTAMQALLFGPSYIKLTVQTAIQKWDPEPANVPYIAYVAKQLGVPATTPMSSLTPAQQAKMVRAMATFEGFKPGKIYKEDGSAPVQVPAPAAKPSVEPPAEFKQGDPNEYKVLPGQEGQWRYQQELGVLDTTAPLVNILHEYPSYTYSISLHILNPSEYNDIVGGVPYRPNRVLISSAGKYNNVLGDNQFIRSQYFSEDFYFDGLELSTVIGVNAVSRNTNAIEFKFSVVEPYGMTLINRLLDQANDPEMDCSNYLDMIYLLQVDFYANDDTGQVVGAIPGTTKRFPIKLTQMDISASVNGATYQINAVPYNHLAYEQSTVGIPANFEIVAGSVGEFFQSGTAINPKSKITSLASALNGWQQDLVKNKKIGIADTFAFDIHPSIAQSAFSSARQTASRDTSMGDSVNSQNIRKSNIGKNTSAFDAQTRTFSLNAGTSIDKAIDYVIRGSDYIKNQITVPDGMSPDAYLQQKAQNANTPLNWFKIVPTVAVGKFDPIRKVYAKNITYSVQPYTIYNVKSDVAPQGKTDKFVKVYNYIYTGKNDDVIDFDINFNTLYYTAQTAYRSALTNLYKKVESAVQSSNDKNSEAYQGSDQNKNSVMPMVVKPQVFNAKSRATGGTVDPKAVAVADLEDSLMTLSSADMLSVQLKIVGDPQFLKQDDCFYSPLTTVNNPNDDPRLTINGSLRTDYSEIYVQLYFRTPTDIDESTGMYNFGSYYTTSVFSGIYKVLTVQSEFKAGLFTQTLDLIRLPYQPNYDYATRPLPVNSARSTDITSQTMVTETTKNNITAVPSVQNAKKMLESVDLQSAQQKLAVNLTAAGGLTKEQLNLKNIVNKVTPTTINRTNEPPLVPPFTRT